MKQTTFFLQKEQTKIAVILTAILFTVTTINAATYYSQSSGNPTELSNWNTVRTGGGSTPAGFTGEDVFVIQSGHNMNSTGWTVGNATVGSVAKLQIENGGIFTGSSTIATSSLTMGSKATLQVDAGGKIIWITNTVSTNSMIGIWAGFEALDAASIFEFQGTVAPYFNAGFPDVNGYGSVILNCSGSNLGINSNIGKIRGNLTVYNASGTTAYNFGNANKTIPIGGNLTIDGANLTFRGLYAAGVCTFNVGGNVTVQNGATFLLANNINVSSLTLDIAGDLSIASGSTLNDLSGTTKSLLSFSGSNKTFTNNGTFNTANLNTQVKTGASLTFANDVTIATGRTLTVDGTLKCGKSVISGAGNFTLNTGATLIHTNAGGIDAVVTVTGTKTLNGTVTYDTSTAINTSRSENINVYVAANKIFINRIEKGDVISIYTVSGQQLNHTVANDNLFEASVEKGLYIVSVISKAGLQTTKVLVK